jgi:hypothetical protein
VKHHRALHSLAQALKKSKKSSSRTTDPSTGTDNGTYRSYGYHTLRFALILYNLDRRTDRIDPRTEWKLDQQNFTQVLIQCENLQTVRIASFTPYLPLHPKSLHRLKIVRSLALDTDSEPILLSGSEHLESLTVVETNGRRRYDTDFISFPRLHTLRMWILGSTIPDWIAHWELPSLKRVTVELRMDEPLWGFLLTRFFAAYREKIQFLDVSPSSENISLSFLSQLPCLEHLALYHAQLSGLAAEAHPLTVGNLVRLDVRTSLSGRVLVTRLEHVVACMTLLVETFQPRPRLRIIFRSLKELQLIDVANEEISSMDHQSDERTALWNNWVADCKGIGLNVVDCTGAPLEFK